MQAQLKRRFDFPGHHLLEHVDPSKKYEASPSRRGTKTIVDDRGRTLHLSKTTLRLYFDLKD